MPGVLQKFEWLLNGYFSSNKPQHTGIPTVGYFAEELHLSANYFGDPVKKESGKTAQEYIHEKLMMWQKKKSSIWIDWWLKWRTNWALRIRNTSPDFFKQQVGSAPNEYRNTLN